MPKGYKHIPDTLESRFFGHYEMIPECGCWIWKKQAVNGYGQIHFQYKKYRASRVSWILHFGAIPEGICVLHRCDTPLCVNPHHLFLGSQKDNTHDMIKKGRKASTKGEKHGMAKLSDNDAVCIFKDTRDQKTIAKHYGVCKGTIANIKQGLNWKHIKRGDYAENMPV